MVCQADIKELWDLRDESKALLLVKHDYQTKAHQKYLGNINENYHRVTKMSDIWHETQRRVVDGFDK